ncbi:MAG: DUF4230 domain-containing protein [Fervidobacterium sp.]|uniref:DUF4230 domain-containing protein n=1 Tax=Fervidobacterium sp. TaxID=1871331 RepID=UPI0025BBDB79|nr:DUF4230 domain-containing protein [Fervidobacterium sp.]NPU90175.1 DUF4230 domain-containing protein [Fervidobacterium sp.]
MKKVYVVILIILAVFLAFVFVQTNSKKTPELSEIFRRTGDFIVEKYTYQFIADVDVKGILTNSKSLYRVVAESYVHLNTNEIVIEEKDKKTIYVKLPPLQVDEPIIDEKNIQVLDVNYGWFTFNDEEMDNMSREKIRSKANEILEQLRAENYNNEITMAEKTVETTLKKFYPDKEIIFEHN